MSDIEHETLLSIEAERLFNALCKYANGKALTTETVYQIRDLVKRHKQDCAVRGLIFPEMVLLMVPRFGYVELVRRDLDTRAIQTLLLNMTVKEPRCTAQDLAMAVTYAWPERRPSEFKMAAPTPMIEGSRSALQ